VPFKINAARFSGSAIITNTSFETKGRPAKRDYISSNPLNWEDDDENINP